MEILGKCCTLFRIIVTVYSQTFCSVFVLMFLLKYVTWTMDINALRLPRMPRNVWNSEYSKNFIASAAGIKDSLPRSNYCCTLHERSSHESSRSMLLTFVLNIYTILLYTAARRRTMSERSWICLLTIKEKEWPVNMVTWWQKITDMIS